jgi:ABC-2 type transport system permease protein
MSAYLAILSLDIRRQWADRTRLIASFVQPLLYLFVLGSGLGASTTMGGASYLQFIFPGVVGLSLLFTASFSAIAIVFDRQVGFLKAVLVAPVSRTTIALGKITSGALQALVPGLLLLVFTPLVGLSFSVSSLAAFLLAMVLSAATFSALGVAVAARFTSVTVFPVVSNALLMPMFFLSGAMYPLDRAPVWLRGIAHLDPAAYAVDLMRAALSGHALFPVPLSIAVLVLFIAAMSVLSVRVFQKGEDD